MVNEGEGASGPHGVSNGRDDTDQEFGWNDGRWGDFFARGLRRLC